MNQSILRWERDFTRTVVRLAWPIMVQSLVSALMYILDNAMIGQLGQAELAGVSQANKVSFLVTIILFGLVSGSSIFSAQFWGKRDLKGIRQIMALSLMVAVPVALLFVAASVIAPGFIMGLLIQNAGSAAAAQAGASYLRIVAATFFVNALIMVEEATLKSTEHVRLPMVAAMAAIVANASFNYLLIFGKFGFPRLGILGGAVATLMGVVLQLAIMLIVSYKNRYPNAIRPRDLRLPPREVVARYFKTVAPVLLNETLWSMGVVMYSVAYGKMGASAVAAMSIFSNVEQLAFVALRGMSTACSILIGKSIGADRMDEAQRDAKRFLAMNMLMGAIVGVFVVLFAGNIAHLFNVPDETREAAKQIIMFYGLFVWLQAANNTQIVGIMRSGGDVLVSGILDVVFLWGVSVPLVSWCGPVLGWPIARVYLMTYADSFLKFLVCLVRILSGKWRHNLVDAIEGEEDIGAEA